MCGREEAVVTLLFYATLVWHPIDETPKEKGEYLVAGHENGKPFAVMVRYEPDAPLSWSRWPPPIVSEALPLAWWADLKDAYPPEVK